MIIADNVFLSGAIWDEPGSHPTWSATAVLKMKDFISRLMNPSLYRSSFVPTSEGLLVAQKI